ncbi:hypothetical protein NDU88_002281 [Pleurodeles waltl]|uniref:Uncharacterized protein n=1 Tax=Pleurodeles waltl TaxID=8319 RepID=A0AAV7SD82_PLEWA|nr:hypothetical protein NDU88_002281 [Pleurodeles waltl]
MMAAVILEEIITGIQGQDSADYQETTLMQEDDGSPVDIPVLDLPDDMDDKLTTISQQMLQDVLGTLQTPLLVARRSTVAAAITEYPPTTPIVRPACSNPAEDSDDTGTTFERTVVGVQQELAKEATSCCSLFIRCNILCMSRFSVWNSVMSSTAAEVVWVALVEAGAGAVVGGGDAGGAAYGPSADEVEGPAGVAVIPGATVV